MMTEKNCRLNKIRSAFIAVVLLAVSISTQFIDVNAATSKCKTLEESFNNEKISDKWYGNNVDISVDYNAMRFNSAYYWSGAAVLNAYQRQDKCRLVFDISLSEYGNDSWIGLGFGGENPSATFDLYDGYILLNPSVVSVVDLKNISSSTSANLQASSGLFDKLSEGKATVTAEFKTISADKCGISLDIRFSDNSSVAYSWNNISLADDNKYFSFNSSNTLWDITSFKVLDGNGKEQFSDDFSQNTMTYETDSYADGNWHICKSYTKEQIFIGQIGKAEFKENDSRLINFKPLSASTDCEYIYEISYLINIAELNNGSAFGLGLGMEKNDSDLDSNAFLGLTKLDDERGAFVLIKDGEIQKTVSAFALASLSVSDNKFKKAIIKIKYDFSVIFSIENLSAKYTDIMYDGYWGMGNVALKSGAANHVYIDDIDMNSYETAAFATEDASNSFAGTKSEKSDGMDVKDYYINEEKWFLGNKVSQKLYIEGDENPALLFNSCNEYSCFGYRQKYDEYVVQFDAVVSGLTDGMKNSSYTGEEFNGQSFGLSFNKSSFFTNASMTASVSVFYNGWDRSNIRSAIRGNKCATVNGQNEVEIADTDINFWADDTTKYNFMFIVRNRTVGIYFKRDSEPESELGICRAEFADVDTDGYVAVFGMGNVSFSLSNYRIINIGSKAIESGESAFSVRETFDGKKVSDKLILNESTKIENGKLSLVEKGGFYTADKMNNCLLNLDVSDINGSFEIDFSGNNAIIFNSEQKTIGFVENGKTRFIDLPTDRNFSDDGYTTEISILLLGNSAEIGFMSEGESTDFLYKPIAEYSWENEFSKESIFFGCSDSIELDNVCIYNLDSDYTAQTEDYSQNNKVAEMWIVKNKSIGEEKFNFIPVICAAAGIIVLTVCASFIIKNKRGKEK